MYLSQFWGLFSIMKFSELQTQLKEKFGIDHLADIARQLEVSPQAVSNWKARGRVPYKYVLKIRKLLKEDEITNADLSGNTSNDNQAAVYPYVYGRNLDEETISGTDIILTLARQLKVIIIMPIVAYIIAFIYSSFFITPIYQCTAKITSQSGSGQSVQSSIASRFGINVPSTAGAGQWVYPEIVKSRTLARKMLMRKFDTKKYGQEKTLLQILTYGNTQPTVGIDTLMKAGVGAVIGMIDIQKKTSYYILTITALEPLFARDFAVALIDELDAHQRDYNKTKYNETRQFIEASLVEVEIELRAAEELLKDFRDHNRNFGNSPALQLEEDRLSREVAVHTSVFTTLKQRLVTTKIEEIKERDYVVVLDTPEAPLSPSNSNKKLISNLSGLLGLILGIIIAFLKEYFETIDKEGRDKIGKAKMLFFKNILGLIRIKPKKHKFA